MILTTSRPVPFFPAHTGKTSSFSWLLRAARFIPAHAGKTSSRSPATSKRRAHPRSRRENTLLFGLPTQATGSSPLTQGKP